jgi:Alginate export
MVRPIQNVSISSPKREIVWNLILRAKPSLSLACSLIFLVVFLSIHPGQVVGAQMMGGGGQLVFSANSEAPSQAALNQSSPRPAGPREKTGRAASRFSPADALNCRLPAWVRFDGDYRARVEEGLSGKLFQANDQDTYFLSLLRLGVTFLPETWLKVRLEGQDARALGKNPPRTSGFYDMLDVRQAYAEFGDTEKGAMALRVGRQLFLWGEGRLVTSSNWSFPGGRSFDAVRLTFRHNGYRLDAFAASATQISRTTSGGFTKPTFGNNIHGLYGGIEKLVPNSVIEPYVFWRIGARVTGEDMQQGDLNFKTYGMRWTGKLPAGFDYGTEMALERGEIANSSFRAWGGHWVLGHTWMPAWKPRLFAEYNYATGDENSSDNKVQTFNTLYASVHLKWGETDQVGWRNIQDMRGGFQFVPRNAWKVSTNYHSYWLANVHDGLYTASGSIAIPRVAAGTAGRWVGQEMDVQGSHEFSNGFEIDFGVGHIFPGTFVRRVASDHGYTYPYAMMAYKF